MITLGSYQVNLGQNKFMYEYSWLYMNNEHLSPLFFSKMKKQHLHFDSDSIHFITSQTLYHSFTIVVCANRAHSLALRGKSQAKDFSHILCKYFKLLEENFSWGWKHLAHLASRPSDSKLLLTQSRLALALRYHNDYIELSKLALHIPSNISTPLSSIPITTTISRFSQQGLSIAIRNILLTSTLNPISFDLDFVRIIIPSIAFIMAHSKVIKTTLKQKSQLEAALSYARNTLERGQSVPFLHATTSAYLDMFDFLAKLNEIEIKHSS
ncbi:hypothetical protein DSO57_1034556 [Entomophthora muscae]|uniref:Uncharacterized protein n=1 Tax=Entomophthora muscae TaxID=34485 RepID=A0ACC2UAL2_9FUNG|nr:hypothetical protein DSO57_1034556 [Entomophthora muscae]